MAVKDSECMRYSEGAGVGGVYHPWECGFAESGHLVRKVSSAVRALLRRCKAARYRLRYW